MRILKKAVLLFVSLFVILLIAIVVIPFFIDVDKYRPQIVQAVNERINGKFELGKLSLSLWGQIKVDVAHVSLVDQKGNPVVAVNDAHFHLPFSSILAGSPTLNFKMQKPSLMVVKDKQGRINVLSLMKETQTPGPKGALPSNKAPEAPAQSANSKFELPGLVAKATLGVEVNHASFIYKDESLSKDPQKINDLNLKLKNISLEKPIELELWAEIDFKMGGALSVQGPFRIEGQAKPELSQGKFAKLSLSLNGNFSDIEILMPGLFEKKKGVKIQFSTQVESTLEKATIKEFDLQFFNAQFKASGLATHLAGAPSVQFSLKSNEIALKPWSELVPLLKSYELGGGVTFEGVVNGPSDKIGYQATVSIKNATARAPYLKSQPSLDGLIKVSTNQLENFWVTVKAPGNDLKIQGKMLSFEKPHLEVSVTSNALDLDQLLDIPKPKNESAKPKPESQGAQGGGSSAKSSTHDQDYDALLNPLRENKMAASSSALVSVNLKALKVYDIKISDIASKFIFRDLAANLENFSLGIWSGTLKANFWMDFKPKAPPYKFGTEVSGLDLKQAVSSQLQMFKNTVYGKAFFKMNGSGSSFNPDPAIKNLVAKGNMKIEKATFTSIDVGKMVSEGLNQSLGKLADKIPSLKGKNINAGKAKESRYDFISSDFSIEGGRFSAPSFFAKAEANQGVDLKGDTKVGMKDYSLNASWEVVDTYNLTHAKDLSVEQAGVKVDHLLAEGGDKPVRFPVHVGCTCLAPCYSYTEVPEFLGKIALSNVTRAVEGKAKAELKKRAGEKLQQLTNQASPAIPPAVHDKLKGLTKKLFGN